MQRRGWAIARVVGRRYFHHGVSDWFLYDLRSVGVQDECRLRTVLCAQFEGYVTEEGAASLRARWYATQWYQQSRFRRDHLLRVHGEWVVVVYAVPQLGPEGSKSWKIGKTHKRRY